MTQIGFNVVYIKPRFYNFFPQKYRFLIGVMVMSINIYKYCKMFSWIVAWHSNSNLTICFKGCMC